MRCRYQRRQERAGSERSTHAGRDRVAVLPHRDEPIRGAACIAISVPTEFWGYAGTFPGPTIETRSGEGFLVEWVNRLPRQAFAAARHAACMAPKRNSRTCARSCTRTARKRRPKATAIPRRGSCRESPRSITIRTRRTPRRSGITITRSASRASMSMPACSARSSFATMSEAALNLPSGECEIPLILCDRMFEQNGRLSYPVSPPPANPWASEFFGNAILVNGKLFPYLDVKPRKYRFRVDQRVEQPLLPSHAVEWSGVPADRFRSGLCSKRPCP